MSEAHRLATLIDDQDLGPLDRPQMAWIREVLTQRAGDDSALVASYAEIADRMRVEGDIQGGMRALLAIAARCWWSNLEAPMRARLVEVTERFPVPETDQRLLFILAMVAPVERGSVVVERIARCWTDRQGATGAESQLYGMAAMSVGDFVHAERFLDVNILFFRTQGSLGTLASMLASHAWVKVQLGDWKQAVSLASEAARMADETGQTNWITISDLAAGTVAAYRGDLATAETFTSAADRELVPRGDTPLTALLEYARGVAALADSRHDEAYQRLRRIFDPADGAHHDHVRSWALVDLVEAAVLSGKEAETSGFVRDLEEIASESRSPLLRAALDFARPVLALDDDEASFQASLGARLASWPFIRARLQLAYGLWLRRRHRTADARAPLRAACDAFDALGAVPWGERGRQELRASGEKSRKRTYDLIDALSPQELQIAQLASAGLSNKEIGQQLFLSHRTIGTHLYRIFPKLGITARSQLRTALENRSTVESR